MPTMKCTLFFDQGRNGWTESYFLDGGLLSYAMASAQTKALAVLRAKMCGEETTIIGSRVSDITKKGDGWPDSFEIKGRQDCESDSPDVTAVALMRNVVGDRHKIIFMRGIPDEVVRFGGDYDFTACGFLDAFNSFAAELFSSVRNWGWLGRPDAGIMKAAVTNYSIAAAPQNTVTITFATPLFTPDVVGTKQTVFFSGINAPQKTALKGNQIVKVESLTVCTLVFPMALFPYVNGGKATWAPSQFNKFGVGPKLLRISERKAGRNFFVQPGRLPARGRG